MLRRRRERPHTRDQPKPESAIHQAPQQVRDRIWDSCNRCKEDRFEWRMKKRKYPWPMEKLFLRPGLRVEVVQFTGVIVDHDPRRGIDGVKVLVYVVAGNDS